MKYLRKFSESVVDSLNKNDFKKKMDTIGHLNLIDIVKGYDIYCGIYKNENELCGHYLGEMDDSVNRKNIEVWAKEIKESKCPKCNEPFGDIVSWIGKEDLNSYEEKLPGEGFYLTSKEDEKEIVGTTNKVSNFDSERISNKENTSNTSKEIEGSDFVKVSPKDISNHLEKNMRPILLCYLNILPEKFKGVGKGKMNEKTIQDALLRLQRECNYGDPMRAKEAAIEFRNFISPVLTSDAGRNNMDIWLGKSDGKKYGHIVKDLENMASCIANVSKGFYRGIVYK